MRNLENHGDLVQLLVASTQECSSIQECDQIIAQFVENIRPAIVSNFADDALLNNFLSIFESTFKREINDLEAGESTFQAYRYAVGVADQDTNQLVKAREMCINLKGDPLYDFAVNDHHQMLRENEYPFSLDEFA